MDTGIFDEQRYFDVLIEYAKVSENDIIMKITATNRGPEAAQCDLLPTLWFRNTWDWGYPAGPMNDTPGRPVLCRADGPAGVATIEVSHPAAGAYWLYAEGAPELLFTENQTNTMRLYGQPNPTPYVKDAYHRYLIDKETGAINPEGQGTKVAALYHEQLEPGASVTLRLRLSDMTISSPFSGFEEVFRERIAEADDFYETVQRSHLSVDERRIQRQAWAGMLWSKQLFYYDLPQWLDGDPAFPPPPEQRLAGRNSNWYHLSNFDVISMPDNWEYPWYATWDLAFHCIALSMIDSDFVKRQLELMTREWYIHPNGQLPAYEWLFDDVNPPVHAWATWRVYKIEGKQLGKLDRPFLEGMFHKLIENFTWWVNRKDATGSNIFQGGFLGMDNIGLFDRSVSVPGGGYIDQSDGTSWMGAYCLFMLKIALELAKEEPVYQDMATKFFEHFLRIAHAMTNVNRYGYSLWDEEDGFFYDVLHSPDGKIMPLKIRSMVGVLPLFAVDTLEPATLQQMSVFNRRMHWFMDNRPELSGAMASIDVPGRGQRHLFALLTRERLVRVLCRLLDENEFLSEYGIRSLSKYHDEHPYYLQLDHKRHTVNYQPRESESRLFGGNSNWRGPIWFPVNFLIIESLQKFHHYYGDDLKVECPTGSGCMMTLEQVATELSRRLIKLFVRNSDGQRPIYGGTRLSQDDPHWRDLLMFHEYFHGDNGAGLGASHQTGWTGLIAKLIQQSGGQHDGED